MRRLGLIGLACLSVLALGAALTSTASALVLPEILPLVEGREFTGKNDGTENPTLVSSEEGAPNIVCTAAKATGTEEAKKPLGLFHITFTGCKAGVGCNSKGDAAETILSLGTWHLVFDLESPELKTATVFLNETVIVECTALAKVEIKALTSGGVLCLDLPITLTAEKKAEFLFHCTQGATGKGIADEKKYFNFEDKVGTEGKVLLLCSKNGSAFKECAELALGNAVYTKAEEIKVDA